MSGFYTFLFWCLCSVVGTFGLLYLFYIKYKGKYKLENKNKQEIEKSIRKTKPPPKLTFTKYLAANKVYIDIIVIIVAAASTIWIGSTANDISTQMLSIDIAEKQPHFEFIPVNITINGTERQCIDVNNTGHEVAISEVTSFICIYVEHTTFNNTKHPIKRMKTSYIVDCYNVDYAVYKDSRFAGRLIPNDIRNTDSNTLIPITYEIYSRLDDTINTFNEKHHQNNEYISNRIIRSYFLVNYTCPTEKNKMCCKLYYTDDDHWMYDVTDDEKISEVIDGYNHACNYGINYNDLDDLDDML